MATKLYLAPVASALEPAAWHSSWNKEGQATAYSLGIIGGTSQTPTITGNGSAGHYVGLCQFVSQPLMAQTISGTIKGQVSIRETATSDDYVAAVAVRIIQSDGTQRGVALAPTSPSGLSNELATTLTNRSLRDSGGGATISLSSVTASEGDRIVVEIGYRQDSAATAQGQMAVAGATATVEMPENDTDTATKYTWVQFSQDLVFADPYYYASASVPADGAAATNATATLTITPPLNVQKGSLVFVQCQSRNSTTWTIGVDGGQTWTSETAFDRASSDNYCRVFWCTFNGTWGANPRFDTTSSTCTSAVMHVFSPKTNSDKWFQDVAAAQTDHAAAATITRTGVTTVEPDAVAIASWATADDNTWGSLSGAGWAVLGASNQYRNTSGSDQSMAFAYQVEASPAATGDVSNTEATNGNDACASWIMAFKDVTPLPLRLKPDPKAAIRVSAPGGPVGFLTPSAASSDLLMQKYRPT
jgi:hypothetical protein